MNDEWRCPTSSLKDWICLYLNVKYLSLADGDASWYTKNASTATANTQCDTFSDCRWDERVAGNRQSGGDDQRPELSLRARIIIGGVFFFLLMNLLGRFDLGGWGNSAVTQISLDANLSRCWGAALTSNLIDTNELVDELVQLIITFTYGWTCDGATKWCSWWRAEIWSTDRRRRQAVAELRPTNCFAEAHVLTVMVVSVEVTVDRTVFVDVIERRRLKKLLKNSRPSTLLLFFAARKKNC